ncbi:YceI family protein [bacterium SCSIO 12741]|nr:YceI family protein [bacterium SCSIO 12741]
MKRITFMAAALSLGVFMSSCGGGEAPKQPETPETQAPEASAPAEKMTHSIDLATSVVNWEGTMMGMYSHSGTINLTEGSLVTEGNNITGGSFTVDMASMAATDENYDASKDQTPEKLVGHLSSPDFFDVANNPTASFEITGANEGNTEIMGTLTIRGKSNAATVKDVVFNAENGTATGSLTFNRKDYDVMFDMPVQEMVLSDDVVLNIQLAVAK